MGLFKDYNEIPPAQFPHDWVSGSDQRSESYFRAFCTDDMDVPELRRVQKLLEKKSVQEFLEPVISKGYYKLVESLSLNELENMQNLSGEHNNVKFFGLIKSTDAKLTLQNKTIVPHKLKEFSTMFHPEMIKPLEPSKQIALDAQVIKICPHCKNGNVKFEPQVIVYRKSETGEHIRVNNSGEVKCSNCNGKWKSGFTFKDFLKYVIKFNEKIEKLNKEISGVNEKSSSFVEEYNNAVKKLNEKISIWNSKCPHNAIDDNHNSDSDNLKFWGTDTNRIQTANTGITETATVRGSLPIGYDAKPSNYLTRGSMPANWTSTSSQSSKNIQHEKSSDDPLKILKLRFAKGEITKEEFEEMKKVLGQ